MINIFAPINPLGYGIHSNNMVKAFVDADVDINLTTIGGIKSESHFEKYWKPAADKKHTAFDKNSPSLYIFHDTQSNTYVGSPMMTFSVFETTKISPVSVHLLNNVADIVLTTTEAHKAILISNGIPEYKIKVVHEGIDPEIFNYYPAQEKWLDTKKFTFITTGKCEARKNTDMVVRSFVEEFQYKEVALICHTYNPFMEQKEPNAVKRFTGINIPSFGYNLVDDNEKGWKFSNGVSDIYFTKPTLNTPEMKQLYHSANVGIQYSRGEGWDLPLNEMLACGVPCIASNCLGHSEYLTGAPSIQRELIIEPVGTVVANDGVWFKGDVGEWADMSQEDLSEKMLYVHENQTKYSRPSPELSRYYTENYTWTAAVDTILNIIQEYQR